MKFGEIRYVNLDPVVGKEMAKTRPCVIVSPDDLNRWFGTFIIAPITGTDRRWRFRPFIKSGKIEGCIALDQIRSVDKSRIGKQKVSLLSPADQRRVRDVLQEMFT